MRDRDREYVDHVTARLPWLRQLAYLLVHDWHRADDVVQTAITQLYKHWQRVSQVENLDGYARTVLVRSFLGERRRWGARVRLIADPPEPAAATLEDHTSRIAVRTALAAVPPRQRATLVLRFYCDLSVEQVADVLRCSQGTVKSQTARGLDALRRVLVSAAAGVLVVGAAAGLTYAMTDRAQPSAGSAATVKTAPAATAPVTAAPRQFDPLVQYASFGWLPEQDALGWRSTSIDPERITLNAQKYAPDPANGPNASLPAAQVSLELNAAGVEPRSAQPIEVDIPAGSEQTLHYGPVTEAPAVNGAPASWVGVPGDPDRVLLKWQYAPDAWAELSASLLSGDPRETVHRIASGLRLGGTERLRFPFHLTGLPADLRPTSSRVEEGGMTWPWHASLDLRTGGEGPGLSVSVHPTSSDNRPPNTEVDGHPARHENVEGDHLGRPEYSDRLYVYDLDGGVQANIIIDATTAAAVAPLSPDGVQGIYRALTVIADRADWTDQPLR